MRTTLPGCRLVQSASYSERELARSVVGLELGASAVKAVAVRGLKGKRRVIWWGLAELDPSLSDQRRRDVVVAVLRRWRSLKGFPGKVAVLAPSGHRFVTVVLPRMPAKELRQAAFWEARSQLYFEDEMVMTACPLPGAADEERVTVVVAGMPEEMRRNTHQMLRLAGLNVKHTVPTAIAFSSLVRQCFPGDSINRLLDLGLGAAKIMALVSEKPVFYRELPEVGANMVKAIAEQAGLNPRLAERVLRRAKLVRDPEEDDPDLAYWGEPGSVQQIIFPEISNLASEVEISTHYLRARYPSEVETIYCVGGLTEIPGLLDYLQEKVRTEFKSLPLPEDTLEYGRPEVKLTYRRNWERFAAATGAALWRLDMACPQSVGIPLKPKRKSPLSRVNLKLVGSLVLTLLVATANLALMPRLRSLESELTAQKQYLEELEQQIESARESSGQSDDPVERLETLRQMTPGWDEVLAALALASDDRIWLQELGGTSQVLGLVDAFAGSDEGLVGEVDEESGVPDVITLQVSGVAASQQDAERFARRLESMGLFAEVHLGSLEREDEGSERTRFVLSLSVAPRLTAGRTR